MYDHPCSLPLFIVCGEHILCCRLRSADRSAADGSVDELSRIVVQIRRAWPSTRLVVRVDSDFGKDDIMVWCEAHDVDYVFGCGQNIGRQGTREVEAAVSGVGQGLQALSGSAVSDPLLMVPSAPRGGQGRVAAGTARRCVVTNFSRKTLRAREFYEQRYCARGAMGNRIKDQQRWLFSDRALAHIMRANQFRMYFGAIVNLRAAAQAPLRIAPTASRHRLMPASPTDIGKGEPGARHAGRRSIKNRASIPSTCQERPKSAPKHGTTPPAARSSCPSTTAPDQNQTIIPLGDGCGLAAILE